MVALTILLCVQSHEYCHCHSLFARQYTGKITYTPVTRTYPASAFWGINVTDSTYGTHTIISQSTAGIVDTGTTCTYYFANYYSHPLTPES